MLTSQEATAINQRVFETSQDLILVTDSFGSVIQVSPSSVAILGFEPAEMIGQSAASFIMPDDLESTREEMRAARRGRATRHFGCRYLHKDGHVVPLVWMAVWSEPDHHHFFIGRDMTDRERVDAQLRQSQKMEAVGQLTGGIAHDFNNILMVIVANIDELQEEKGFAPHVMVALESIGNAAQRAAELTGQLLAFSRKQTLLPRNTNLNDLVLSTKELLKRSLGAHIEIKTFLSEDLRLTNVDRIQFESALINLCVNARDAMPDGGQLVIETANISFDASYIAAHADVAEGDYVMLSVSDSGTGMQPHVIEKAFDPFFTTKDVGKGSGLGLSMVYGFIKQSSGHVRIYSEMGHGTSIRLYLPRSDGLAEALAERQDGPMPRGAERILVVEDDLQVQAGVVQQLQSLGYTVSHASNGIEGLQALEACSRPYDLLLTDVVMPGPVGGKALAEEVKRLSPNTKIVFMSGYSENFIGSLGRFDREVMLLMKPFRKYDLAQTVRRALGAGDPGSGSL